MISIKDVAKEAGVSISTVSRALNNYSDVKENTRMRIIDIANKLAYRPSQSARNLSSKKKENVAIIISELGNNSPMDEFTGNVLKGLNRYIQGKDMTIAMYGISSQMQKKRSLKDFCREYSLSGVILAGLKLTDTYIEEIKNIDIACVGIDLKLEGKMAASILTDDIKAFCDITNYVLSKGYKKIALVSGKKDAGVSLDRYKGFYLAIEANNIKKEDIDILEGNFDEELAYKLTTEYIKKYKKTRARAFICMSDLMAIAVVRAIQDLSYNISDDFFVTGFDGIQVLNYIRPKIATIDQNMIQKGYEGMKLLMSMLRDSKNAKDLFVDYTLIKEK